MNETLILSTADSIELAQKLARALVEAGQAACVNIVPGIRSVYRWQGKVNEEGEWLLLIKTTADRFEKVRATIRRLHTYQVPEIIAVPVIMGDPDYVSWLRQQTSDGRIGDPSS